MIVIPKNPQRKPVTTHSIVRYLQPNFPVPVALEQDHEGFFFFVFGDTGEGGTWMVPPTSVFTNRLTALSEPDWLGVATIAYSSFTADEVTQLQITRTRINDTLKGMGFNVTLMPSDGYFYLTGKDVDHVESKVIWCDHIAQMSFDDWINTIIRMIETPVTLH